MSKLVIACSLENCVHVGGVMNFLRLAEDKGFRTHFLGPAVPVENLLDAVVESDPEYVAVSYRLTAETARNVFEKLEVAIIERGLQRYKFILGATEPVAREAADFYIFKKIFDGRTTAAEVISYLDSILQKTHRQPAQDFREQELGKQELGAQKFREQELREQKLGALDLGEQDLEQEKVQTEGLLKRINRKKPLPLIRHHYGQPDLETTLQGIEKIAQSGVLDIISLGPDQNTQEFFFEPENMKEELSGAGGVPIRKVEDFEEIYQASRRGNYPLLRCYSGTNNLIRMAEILQKTIDNAWAAIPLTWYSELDGRSKRDLLTAIKENTAAMKWHGERNIPVEVNESHHWSLRDAPDVIAVVMAYLAAYNARKNGVKDYLAQYMFNNPSASGYQMDIAKMLAKQELIARLARGETGETAARGEVAGHEDVSPKKNFNIITQVRAGLASFPADFARARAQLALSTWQSMVLKPDIVHVVGYTEADHAARADEVIESCRIAGHIIEKSLQDYPDYRKLERIQSRKTELTREAEFLLKTIDSLYGDTFDDPLASPEAISRAIKQGLIDAPHLKNNQAARGEVSVKIINGAVYSYDYGKDRIITEEERVERLLRD